MGDKIFNNDTLNKDRLVIFELKYPKMLKQLKKIIHPAVKRHFDNWLIANKNSPIVVKEAAILFESGSYKDCDIIITIVAPLETRIKRVIDRDGVNSEAVLSRIYNQWTDEMRMEKSDYVIENEDIKISCAQTKNILKILSNQ